MRTSRSWPVSVHIGDLPLLARHKHFDRIDREAVVRRSLRRLQRLGYQLTVAWLAA